MAARRSRGPLSSSQFLRWALIGLVAAAALASVAHAQVVRDDRSRPATTTVVREEAVKEPVPLLRKERRGERQDREEEAGMGPYDEGVADAMVDFAGACLCT